MSQLTRTTKIKLIMPICYFLLANIIFVILFDSAVPIHQIIGITLADLGFILWITARVQLGNAFSIAPTSKFLVKSGLYSKFRHPVYYASILAVIGLCIFIGSQYMWLIVFALTVLEIIRIRKEEEVLTRAFGKEYVEYKIRTWF